MATGEFYDKVNKEYCLNGRQVKEAIVGGVVLWG